MFSRKEASEAPEPVKITIQDFKNGTAISSSLFQEEKEKLSFSGKKTWKKRWYRMTADPQAMGFGKIYVFQDQKEKKVIAIHDLARCNTSDIAIANHNNHTFRVVVPGYKVEKLSGKTDFQLTQVVELMAPDERSMELWVQAIWHTIVAVNPQADRSVPPPVGHVQEKDVRANEPLGDGRLAVARGSVQVDKVAALNRSKSMSRPTSTSHIPTGDTVEDPGVTRSKSAALPLEPPARPGKIPAKPSSSSLGSGSRAKLPITEEGPTHPPTTEGSIASQAPPRPGHLPAQKMNSEPRPGVSAITEDTNPDNPPPKPARRGSARFTQTPTLSPLPLSADTTSTTAINNSLSIAALNSNAANTDTGTETEATSSIAEPFEQGRYKIGRGPPPRPPSYAGRSTSAGTIVGVAPPGRPLEPPRRPPSIVLQDPPSSDPTKFERKGSSNPLPPPYSGKPKTPTNNTAPAEISDSKVSQTPMPTEMNSTSREGDLSQKSVPLVESAGIVGEGAAEEDPPQEETKIEATIAAPENTGENTVVNTAENPRSTSSSSSSVHTAEGVTANQPNTVEKTPETQPRPATPPVVITHADHRPPPPRPATPPVKDQQESPLISDPNSNASSTTSLGNSTHRRKPPSRPSSPTDSTHPAPAPAPTTAPADANVNSRSEKSEGSNSDPKADHFEPPAVVEQVHRVFVPGKRRPPPRPPSGGSGSAAAAPASGPSTQPAEPQAATPPLPPTPATEPPTPPPPSNPKPLPTPPTSPSAQHRNTQHAFTATSTSSTSETKTKTTISPLGPLSPVMDSGVPYTASDKEPIYCEITLDPVSNTLTTIEATPSELRQAEQAAATPKVPPPVAPYRSS